MNQSINPFRWSRAKDGYRWIKIGKQLWLSPPAPTGFEIEQYNPFANAKDSGLFRNFSKLECGEDHIIKFANKYGMLGEPKPKVFSGKKTGKLASMESLAQWVTAINRMRDAVELWDALNSERPGVELRKYIKWPSLSRVDFVTERDGWERSDTIADKNINPDVLGRIKSKRSQPDKNRMAAKLHLQSIINDVLKQRTASRLILIGDDELKLSHVPTTLLGAMWVQFADAVSGNKTYRQCAWCNNEFELAPGKNRADRIYCTPSCRSSANRKLRRTVK